MTIWTVLLAFGIGLGLGTLVMAITSISSRETDCATCPTACAWSHVRDGLTAKGWDPDCITPETVIALAPQCHGGRHA